MHEVPTQIDPGTRAPGYRRAPDHKVAFIPSARRVRILVGDLVVVESRDVVIVEEGSYPVRYYVNRDDVGEEGWSRTDETTYCPFKGLAVSLDLHVGDELIAGAAWSYEQPFHEAELLRDRIAFYDNKVTQVLDPKDGC